RQAGRYDERVEAMKITLKAKPKDSRVKPALPMARSGRRLQPLPIRVAHWLNVLFIVLMAGSGLQILAAYPSLGPQGAQYRWYPLQGVAPPQWLRIGGWLAGARHWHFAIAWFFILNALLYAAYLGMSGEWRRRLFLPRRDGWNALLQFAYYVR